MSRYTLRITDCNDDEVVVPAHNVVCPCCDGSGTIENPAFAGGFTMSEFQECFEDEEARAAYFSGRYDVGCTECNGRRVVLVPDTEAELNAEQRAALAWRDELAHERRLNAMEREAELRMGA